VAEINAFMMGRDYANRSEAIRDLGRSRRQISKWQVARRSSGTPHACCE
jgi:metal-responsive CopG/Arc/MetJ family transcriptional regulator